jgi:cytochrome P450
VTSPTTDSGDAARKSRRYDFDRHAPDYRHKLADITSEMQDGCPIAWSETYGGHFVAAGHHEVFEVARAAPYVSNEYAPEKGRLGILIPGPGPGIRSGGGFLEMDPPRQRHYRQALNPYLSPAAIARWVPVVDEVVRACIDEKIGTGRIDFVDDLANIVPAVVTMGLLGAPLKTYDIYVEPTHASVYLRPDSPEMAAVRRKQNEMSGEMVARLRDVKANGGPPGLIHALAGAVVDGSVPSDRELTRVIGLIIGGGFDTTTALTAHSLEWLGENPSQRARLSASRDTLLDSATEEFLRFYTPAPGDGRTITADCEIAGQRFKEGDRVWISWTMANRDPAVFENPHEIDLARSGNRHVGFGLGLHRCIGSNVARVVFKRMLLGVLDRLPDYVCDPAGAVHYDTIGVINGMKNLPATFTPGPRLGPGLAETLEIQQEYIETHGIAEPVIREN